MTNAQIQIDDLQFVRIEEAADDRLKLYPEIAKQSGLRIVEEFHRAVTKRTEQGDDPYQETVFFMMKEVFEDVGIKLRPEIDARFAQFRM
jgi:hypothetical protein